jgi:hypothetical protein
MKTIKWVSVYHALHSRLKSSLCNSFYLDISFFLSPFLYFLVPYFLRKFSCKVLFNPADISIGEPRYFRRYSDRLLAGRPGQGIFLFSIASRPGLRPTQLPIQCVLGNTSPRVKQPGRENYHSSLPSAEVKNGGYIPPLPHPFSLLDA